MMPTIERMVLGRRRHKFGARKVEIDGIRFDSRKEARRYRELRLLEQAGAIRDLRCHPRFELVSASPIGELVRVGTYTADFAYWEGARQVIEDVKSGPTRTQAYRLRKRIAEACHGIVITEV